MMNSKIFLASFVSFLFLVSFAHGLGIAAMYQDERPLLVYPGQTTEFDYIMANQGSSTEINAKGGLESGTDIASIVDPKEIYTAKPYENYLIKTKVVIPPNASIGTEYRITLRLEEINAPSGTGMISMGVGIRRSVPVIVKTKEEILGIEPLPEKTFPWLMVIGIAAIIILLIAYFLWRKFKKPEVSQNPATQPSPAVTAPKNAVNPQQKK